MYNAGLTLRAFECCINGTQRDQTLFLQSRDFEKDQEDGMERKEIAR